MSEQLRCFEPGIYQPERLMLVLQENLRSQSLSSRHELHKPTIQMFKKCHFTFL